MQKFRRHPYAAAVLGTGLLPLAAGAAIDTPAKFVSLADKIGGLLFGVLVTIAGIFIIFAAFQFLISAGDPKRVASARNQLLYAVVAVIVAYLSRAIIGVVYNMLQ